MFKVLFDHVSKSQLLNQMIEIEMEREALIGKISHLESSFSSKYLNSFITILACSKKKKLGSSHFLSPPLRLQLLLAFTNINFL